MTFPIFIDNNRNSRSVQSTENDEYEMADLIAEGTILAVYTDESDSNYYLFRASSCPQVLTKDTNDDWGITYEKEVKLSMVVILTEPENFYHSNCWIENVRLFQLRL